MRLADLRPNRCLGLVAVGLAFGVIHSALVEYVASIKSPLVDEPAHLVSGVCYLRTGSTFHYRVNPPLVRTLAAWPIFRSVENCDCVSYPALATLRSEFELGRDSFNANPQLWHSRLRSSRRVGILFSLIGLFVCSAWAYQLWGCQASVAAASLWCFQPMIIGWSATITPDVPAASTGVLACFAFWYWLEKDHLIRMIAAGVTLGIALLTKTTWITLLFLWPVLTILSGVFVGDRIKIRAKQSAGLVVILTLGLVILNGAYEWNSLGRPLRDFRFQSHRLQQVQQTVAERASLLEMIPMPLPENYIYGLDVQIKDFEAGKASYLCGERKEGGWWYYYAVVLLVKTPAGFLAIILLAVSMASVRRREMLANGEFERIAVAVILMTAMMLTFADGMSRHGRYGLIAAPWLIVWSCRIFATPSRRRTVAWAMLGLGVASTLSQYPHQISYFNYLIGGPRYGDRWLLDSNIDWGQDWYLVERWKSLNPEKRPLFLATSGPTTIQHSDFDASIRLMPRETSDGSLTLPAGYYAMSVNTLHGYPRERRGREYFANQTPIDRLGNSIRIFHLTVPIKIQ